MTGKYSLNKTWLITHYTERYAQSSKARQPLVLLSGWSCDSQIFDWLISGLSQHFVIVNAELNVIPEGQSFEACCKELADTLFPEFTQAVSFLGWSLGGNIAIEIASKYPQRCKALTLLASSPVFVNHNDVNWAMQAEEFEAFKQQVANDAAKGLKQFDKLMTHSNDKSNARSLRLALKDYRQGQVDNNKIWSHNTLNTGLDFLASLDQRDCIKQLEETNISVHSILFSNDALVSPNTERCYSQCDVVEGASHLGFLTHTDTVYHACLSMLDNANPEPSRNKQSIAASFSHAAVNYDGASDVQQRIAAKVYARLEASIQLNNKAPQYIIDAGCGTGLWTEKLKHLAKHVTGVDFADGMLNFAKSQHPSVQHWLQADLENMPLIAEQSDYIFSSLAVQWCDNFNTMLAHWYTLLKPDGEVILATLATDTLHELAECFTHVDAQTHVNDFYSYQQLLGFVEDSQFSLEYSLQENEVQYYSSAIGLMHDLKSIGAQTIKTNKGLVKPKPMTKSQLSLVSSSYEKYRTADKRLPATYDVVYLHLRKPA